MRAAAERLAVTYVTTETADDAAVVLNAMAAELVQLVQARTGQRAVAVHGRDRTIKAEPVGGAASGAVPSWCPPRIAKADPLRLEIHWEIEGEAIDRVDMKAELWLRPSEFGGASGN